MTRALGGLSFGCPSKDRSMKNFNPRASYHPFPQGAPDASLRGGGGGKRRKKEDLRSNAKTKQRKKTWQPLSPDNERRDCQKNADFFRASSFCFLKHESLGHKAKGPLTRPSRWQSFSVRRRKPIGIHGHGF